ncbi:MAG: hypothetical protein WA851_06875 [Xanthobacteraceae bacterium]
MIYVNGAIPTFKTAIASAMSLRVNRFSNRPFGVKRVQTTHHDSVDVTHGLVLLFGIGTKALVWGFLCQGIRRAAPRIFFLRRFLDLISMSVSSFRPAHR